MPPLPVTVCVLLAVLRLCTARGGATDLQWYRTAQGTADRLTRQADLHFGSDFPSNVTITINRSTTYQTVLGFGGAFTESASSVFSKLNSSLQAKVLDMYFSESGLQYNVARLPIGSCDFSLGNYNYDSVKGDVALEHFSIDHDKELVMPFIKRAIEVRQQWTSESLNIIASPWSPPAWMKEDEIYFCPLSCLLCTLKKDYHASWALYFSKFLSAYSDEGITIWGVTVQNEPEACPMVYEGMHWTPETERDFLKNYLGPTLKTDHPNISILIYDHNKDHVVEWASTILSDPDAAKYVWGTAIHWYTGDQFNNVNTTHYLFPDTPILATEATESREKDPKNPTWSKGEHYAHDMMGDMNNWVVGFIDWNLILDMLGGPNHSWLDECEGVIKCGSDAMILADYQNGVIYPQIFYYYVGHTSKFVPRGSLRISRSVAGSELECVAFLTPEKQVVVVVMNRGDDPVTYKLLDVVEGGVGQAVKLIALPHSIQTFLYA